MIDPGRLGPYLLAVVGLFLAPGPSVVLAFSRGIAHGRRAALIAVAGNTLGLALQLVLVVLVPDGILHGDRGVAEVLKFAGAIVLVYLGIRAIRSRGAFRRALQSGAVDGSGGAGGGPGGAVAVPGAPGAAALLGQGCLVGLTNPKGLITFTTIAPTFLDRTHGTATGAVFLLGLIALVAAFVADAAWGLFSGAVRTRVGRSTGRLEGLSLGSGALMIGFGLLLAVLGLE